MAEALYNAMKGWGTDEDGLINVVCATSFEDMAAIREEYGGVSDGKDLIKHIKSEISGDFKKAMVGLCTDRAEYDAMLLYKAFKGFGTNESLMTEVCCYRTKDELKSIEAAYNTLYEEEDVDLMTKIENETSGNVEKAILKCFDEVDEKQDPEDDEMIEEECVKLYKAGEKKFGTDEGTFIRIIAGASREYREKLYWKYPEVSKKGYSLTKAIKSEFSGTLEKVLVALVEPTHIHYAEKMHKAMAGLGTNEDTLIRCVVTQKERYLQQIAEYYLQKYEVGLKQHIASEISGDFKKCLITVMEDRKSVV